MNNTEIRLECLRLAKRDGYFEPTSDVLKRANALYDFVRGIPLATHVAETAVGRKMIRPTNGRVMLYHPGANPGPIAQHDPAQPLMAHVCHVWGDHMVNLDVVDSRGVHHFRSSVPIAMDAEDRDPAIGGYAEWMPYQLGQAAKTEAAVKSSSEMFAAAQRAIDTAAKIVFGRAERLVTDDMPRPAAALLAEAAVERDKRHAAGAKAYADQRAESQWTADEIEAMRRHRDRLVTDDMPKRPHLRADGWPTRADAQLRTSAERIIADAMAAVEALGASPALTDAVTLLGEALGRVADHVEGRV